MAYRISRVSTKSGDDGTTGVAAGERLPKDDPRIEALGAIDELNSHLGLLLALAEDADVCRRVGEVQQDLFDLGAVVARGRVKWAGEEKVAWLEGGIGELNARLPPLAEFILPGGGAAAAQCHVARAVCRRAERRLVGVAGLPGSVRVYLNRLSDLLFVMARQLAAEQGLEERPWRGSSPPE